MIVACILVFALYSFSILLLIYGFKKLPYFTKEDTQPKTQFSVVIPFRNEAENLPELLNSLKKLKYPSELFEIIFINDDSEDDSEAIIIEGMKNFEFSYQLIQNLRKSNSPKKDAITEAIRQSKNSWILTTDADCHVPETWLSCFDGFIQKQKAVFVAGPVQYVSNGSYIENFQLLDGLSLQAVTLGSFGLGQPILCNGANLAYRKDVFEKVNGFSGNDHLASGDDIFLLEKMKRAFPKKVRFLKSREAIILTKPQKTWKAVLNQRIRWASKTSKQKNVFSLFLGILVFVINILMLIIPFITIFQPELLKYYVLFIVLKIIVDYILLSVSARFFRKKLFFTLLLTTTYVYALLITLVIAKSISSSYQWKGRTHENSLK